MILPKVDECPIEPQLQSLIAILAIDLGFRLGEMMSWVMRSSGRGIVVKGIRLDSSESRIFSQPRHTGHKLIRSNAGV